MVNENAEIELIVQDLKAIVTREDQRHLMDQHLTSSMRHLLEDLVIPNLQNELDLDCNRKINS